MIYSTFNCACPAGKSGDEAKIVKVVVDPDPPVKGKSVTVNAEILLSKSLYVLPTT